MDTLSASVSSFTLPSLPPPPSQPPLRSISRRFKATLNATTSATSTNLSKPTSSSPSASYSHNKNPNFPRLISFPLPHTKPSRVSPPPTVYDKAASGFAAALVSVCQSKNCLGRTQEDVRRLMEFVMEEENKRKKVLVNDVVEKGKFGKHIKGLVKMLIARGKSGILFDVLMEFERICNDLVVVGTTKLVWVS